MQKVQYFEQPSMIDTRRSRPRRAPAAWRRTSRSREGDIPPASARSLARRDQARQAVQGLRAEHHVHIGRAGDDRLALLAGHAAAHADDQPGLLLLEQRTRPRSWNTFSCAFSRTEQVLKRITSASSGLSVLTSSSCRRRARPPSCRSRTRSSGTRRCGCRVSSSIGECQAEALRQVGRASRHPSRPGRRRRHRPAASSGVRIHTRCTWPLRSTSMRTTYSPDTCEGTARCGCGYRGSARRG